MSASGVSAALTELMTAAARSSTFDDTMGTTCEARKRPSGSWRTLSPPSARTGFDE